MKAGGGYRAGAKYIRAGTSKMRSSKGRGTEENSRCLVKCSLFALLRLNKSSPDHSLKVLSLKIMCWEFPSCMTYIQNSTTENHKISIMTII